MVLWSLLCILPCRGAYEEYAASKEWNEPTLALACNSGGMGTGQDPQPVKVNLSGNPGHKVRNYSQAWHTACRTATISLRPLSHFCASPGHKSPTRRLTCTAQHPVALTIQCTDQSNFCLCLLQLAVWMRPAGPKQSRCCWTSRSPAASPA